MNNLVLIVDDNPSNIQLMATVLLENGYEPGIAMNAKEAYRFLEEHTPELILLDVEMPEIDGYEACKTIKEIHKFKDIPVIFLTVKSEIDDIVKGFDSGAVDYVTKPFNSKVLISRVKTHIELKRAQQHAQSLVKDLKKIDQNKNQFLCSLSHELRNPLASMMMSLSLVKMADPNSEATHQARVIFERQTIQLSRLVDDLLEVTRINQNKVKLKKAQLELNNLVSRTVEDYKQMFAEKGVNLEVNNPLEAIHMQADATRLTQVIGNLLHNASKFTDAGGKTVVEVSLDEDTQEAVVKVKDSGRGIGSEAMEDLFEPFTQSEVSLDRSSGGIGLGLAIVKGMVELHGGSVSASSDGVGKGSEFMLRLPLLLEKNIMQEHKEPKKEKISHSRRILVIDDIPDVAEVLRSLLSFLGHEVTSAHNGTKGLSVARSFLPEVIFCDIGLPGMNGYEVAQSIREIPQLKDVLLIALSGYAQPEDMKRSKEAGFNCHLAKPVDLAKLEQVLAESFEVEEASFEQSAK